MSKSNKEGALNGGESNGNRSWRGSSRAEGRQSQPRAMSLKSRLIGFKMIFPTSSTNIATSQLEALVLISSCMHEATPTCTMQVTLHLELPPFWTAFGTASIVLTPMSLCKDPFSDNKVSFRKGAYEQQTHLRRGVEITRRAEDT